LYGGMPSGRTKISPKSGRGLGHVTPTIFVSTVGYPSDSLASCYIYYTLLQLHVYGETKISEITICKRTYCWKSMTIPNQYEYCQLYAFQVLMQACKSVFRFRFKMSVR